LSTFKNITGIARFNRQW